MPMPSPIALLLWLQACPETTGKTVARKEVGTPNGWVILEEAKKKQPSQALTPEMRGVHVGKGRGNSAFPASSAGPRGCLDYLG